MRVDRTTRLPHPAEDVVAWHSRPGALVRLTPPGLGRADSSGDLAEGSRVTVRMGPDLLPGALRPVWRLRHSGTRADPASLSFTDTQLTGPFRLWRHRHDIGPEGDGTAIRDRIDAELPGGTTAGEGTLARTLEGLFGFRERQLRDDLAFHGRHAHQPRRTVAIAGASGLIGTQLAALLSTGGHTVLRMVRGRAAGPGEIAWDPARGRLDPADLAGVDAVVNLAGRSIATRLTPRARREILASRTASSALLAEALASLPADARPRVLVQASAIGAYGAQRPGELLTESDAFGEGFLAEVVRAWEGAARPAAEAGVRTVLLRTGVVLSDGGGALLPQLPLYRIGLGGRIAPARARLSWITLDDMARAYAHALLTEELEGPVNAVGPRPVSQREFARTLGRVLHRPALLPVPAVGPRLLLGTEGARELVLADQAVSDARLRASGFDPAATDLEDALRHVLRR